jgi:hypothetical protein
MMRKSVYVGVVALLGLAACGDQLSVENLNEPDVERVLSTAKGIEAAVAGLGSQVNNTQRASESVNTQAKLMAEESFASVANFGMAARVANRSLISNELGNDNANSNQANYFQFQQVARAAANDLAAYRRVAATLDTLSDVDENRMRAFAYFILARTLANTAVAYDSGAAVTEDVSTEDIPELLGATELNNVAISYYDSAQIIAERGMSAMPNTWISGVALSQANFVRLVRSYRARARAAVARDPAERAAVDWTAVIADATNGITADHNITIGGTTGWGAGFDAGQMYVIGGWHSVPMMFAGMADVSGAYQAWAATAAGSRRAFLVVTPDLRWPQGATRAAQQADTPDNTIAPRYFRNRPTGDDVVGAGTGESYYDHRRYGGTQASATGGPYTELSKTEIDMLAAEGYLRAGNVASALPLIDITRELNGLPALEGSVATLTDPVPGGASCVPKLPDGSCGTVWDALKYEKRMETAFTGYLVWFTDQRGWGDLRANTVVEWPVPYQEMQARQKPFYNGNRLWAGPSTYGF